MTGKTDTMHADAITVRRPKPTQMISMGAMAMIGIVWNSTAYG